MQTNVLNFQTQAMLMGAAHVPSCGGSDDAGIANGGDGGAPSGEFPVLETSITRTCMSVCWESNPFRRMCLLLSHYAV